MGKKKGKTFKSQQRPENDAAAEAKAVEPDVEIDVEEDDAENVEVKKKSKTQAEESAALRRMAGADEDDDDGATTSASALQASLATLGSSGGDDAESAENARYLEALATVDVEVAKEKKRLAKELSAQEVKEDDVVFLMDQLAVSRDVAQRHLISSNGNLDKSLTAMINI